MEEVNAIRHQFTIFLVDLFNTLEHVFNRTLMLTTTILGTLIVKHVSTVHCLWLRYTETLYVRVKDGMSQEKGGEGAKNTHINGLPLVI